MPAIMDDKGNVEVTCDDCGERITHSNEYGMFCDNNCGLAESKAAKKQFENMLPGLMAGFGFPADK